MELSREYQQVVLEARAAMRRTITDMVPDDIVTARQLLTVALVGDFADLVRLSMGRRDVLAHVNQQLADAGLEIVERARH